MLLMKNDRGCDALCVRCGHTFCGPRNVPLVHPWRLPWLMLQSEGFSHGRTDSGT